MKYLLIIIVALLILFIASTFFMDSSKVGIYLAKGIVIGLPIIVIILFIFALKDAYKSFKSGKSIITFNEWLLNIIPFRPIETLIKQVYPDEHVVSKRLCFDGIAGFLSFSKIPVNAGYKLNLPCPAFLAETSKGYYIDRRLQNIVNSIVLITLGYLLLTLYINISRTDNPQFTFKFFYYIFIFVAGTQIFFALFWQTSRIDIIRKAWLTKEEKNNHSLKISGTMPKNSQLSLSTDKFINMGRITLPFKQVFFLV